MTLFKLIHLMLLIVLSLAVTKNSFADINGAWNLQGVLRIDSTVKGKSATIKKPSYSSVASFDTVDTLQQFSLGSKPFELTGKWSANKTSFKGVPDDAQVRALLNLIKKDVQVRSNLALSLEPGKWTLVGKEIVKKGRPTKISGTLTIKAKTLYQDYSKKNGEPYAGSLSIKYVFTGVKA